MNKIRILIVDDHPMMREALAALIEDEADMELAGEASSGAQAIQMAARGGADIILMDLLMAGMSGLQAIEAILQANPGARIMVLTSMEDEERVLEAIQTGALGYFPKTAPREYLLDGIRKVADGVPYLPSGIAAKLFAGLRKQKLPVPAVEKPLTARQSEVLALLGEGRSDAEIGKLLHLSETTVRTHLFRVMHRLGLETRAQLSAYAHGRRQKEE